ncbi:MAG: hypothetical protein EB023_15360 [Flavobacteriia bacterium]|nr:hypothetical protein [Flavobacteriia bacterium]
MNEMLMKYKNTSTVVVFHGINPPQSGETHYQTFVLDFQTRTALVIDPAMTWRKSQGKYIQEPGIYKPFLALNTLFPFLKTKNFETSFMRTTHPCQDCEDDIYCQSWTMYVLVQYLCQQRTQPIVIPCDQLKRYTILLRFFKQIFSLIPECCDELRAIYKYNVTYHRAIVQNIPKQERKHYREYMASIDPCVILKKMTRRDLSME